jgi:uncharacterized membrane protein YfcA
VTLAALCGLAFFAGMVDAVVGGGGLIQVPALLLLLPAEASRDVASVLGTNKAASICGTAMAVFQYGSRIAIRWQSIAPAAGAAFAFAFAGSLAVAHVDGRWLEPLILVLLVAVAVYTFRRPDLGRLHAPVFALSHERLVGMAVGAALGFYDGFFGPGTGSFLMFTFVGLFGFDFLTASASAKVINFSTNLAALAIFASTGHVLVSYALPMAAAQVAGSFAGTRVALAGGNRVVRVLFLAVATVLIARFGWDVLVLLLGRGARA